MSKIPKCIWPLTENIWGPKKHLYVKLKQYYSKFNNILQYIELTCIPWHIVWVGNRSHDLLLARQTLYPQSHCPCFCFEDQVAFKRLDMQQLFFLLCVLCVVSQRRREAVLYQPADGSLRWDAGSMIQRPWVRIPLKSLLSCFTLQTNFQKNNSAQKAASCVPVLWGSG